MQIVATRPSARRCCAAAPRRRPRACPRVPAALPVGTGGRARSAGPRCARAERRGGGSRAPPVRPHGNEENTYRHLVGVLRLCLVERTPRRRQLLTRVRRRRRCCGGVARRGRCHGPAQFSCLAADHVACAVQGLGCARRCDDTPGAGSRVPPSPACRESPETYVGGPSREHTAG